jgi:hypothetical protein
MRLPPALAGRYRELCNRMCVSQSFQSFWYGTELDRNRRSVDEGTADVLVMASHRRRGCESAQVGSREVVSPAGTVLLISAVEERERRIVVRADGVGVTVRRHVGRSRGRLLMACLASLCVLIGVIFLFWLAPANVGT